MKDWKKTLLGVALAVSMVFNIWPGEKPDYVVDAEPWVDAAVEVLQPGGRASGIPEISRVVRVYDGDTIYVDIDNWPSIVGDNIGIRFHRIDTPEIRGKTQLEKNHAIFVRDYVAGLVGNATTVELRNIKRGKYFRLLADVECDGVNLSDKLLELGYAKPYDGGGRAVWTAADFADWGPE